MTTFHRRLLMNITRTRMSVRSYRDLEVWQMSMKLTAACYKATAGFPREERYGLTSQIRRAAVSVPANIAEGYGRDQTGPFIQFLKISQGSLRELETHILLAQEIGFMNEAPGTELLGTCERISKMLRSLIRSIESYKSDSG